MKFIVLLFSAALFFSCGNKEPETNSAKPGVLTGADILLSKKMDLLKDKNIAIATNQTGRLKNGVHLIDTLINAGIKIKALFGPEHGLRGEAPAGKKINDGIDDKTGIPVFSLYGKTRKPSPEMLKGIDVIIFDIQDIGARFYTYISTMYYLMEAAAENNIEFIVLDRPNPIGGTYVNGPLLQEQFKSFVGIAPLPIAHGMTVGELAHYFKGEELFPASSKLKLTVLECENWKRDMKYNKTKLNWINPSPNIPNFETAFAYPGLCLLEATNISEGRGTKKPFLRFGAPFIDSAELLKYLELSEIEGVEFKRTEFTPKSIPQVALQPKYENELCRGIEIHIKDFERFDPVNFGITLIYELRRLFTENFKINEKRMAKIYGSGKLIILLEEGKTPLEIIASWKEELDNFKDIREKYLLYR